MRVALPKVRFASEEVLSMSYLMKSIAFLSSATLLAACSAMEGTNVGVNIPIGGVVNVSANKTIGERSSSTKAKSEPEEESEPASTEER